MPCTALHLRWRLEGAATAALGPMAPPRRAALAAALALACLATWAEAGSPRLSKERLVFQTDFGDLHMAFYPDVSALASRQRVTLRRRRMRGWGKGSSAWGGGEGRALPAAPAPVTGRHASTPGAPTPSHELPQVAPRTVEHMRKLGEMGLFNTNHFFRVDRGFVAQTADVLGGRSAPMNPEQKVRGRGAVRQGAQSCCAQRGSSRGLEWLVGAALLGADAQHAIACPRPASRPPTQPAASRRPRRRSTCLWRW